MNTYRIMFPNKDFKVTASEMAYKLDKDGFIVVLRNKDKETVGAFLNPLAVVLDKEFVSRIGIINAQILWRCFRKSMQRSR